MVTFRPNQYSEHLGLIVLDVILSSALALEFGSQMRQSSFRNLHRMIEKRKFTSIFNNEEFDTSPYDQFGLNFIPMIQLIKHV